MKKLMIVFTALFVASICFGQAPTQPEFAVSTTSSFNIEKFGGDIYYISTTGSDSDAGTSPDAAFLTIGHGLTTMSDGDALNIKAGTYTETGLTVANNSA